MSNSSHSQLDFQPIMQRVFNESSDTLRMEIENTSLSFDVSGDSGDNLVALGTEDGSMGGIQHALQVDASGRLKLAQSSISQNGVLDNNSSSDAPIIAPFSVIGLSTFYLYSSTTSNIKENKDLLLQFSPDDSADVWFQTDILAPGLSNENVVAISAPRNIVARRARVMASGGLSSGSVIAYLVGQGNG